MSKDDEDLKKISRLLEVGATMLADHCTDCGAPLFRYHGEVMCPLCNSSMPQNTQNTPNMQQTQTQTQPRAQPDNRTTPHVTPVPAIMNRPKTQPPATPVQEGQTTLENVIQTKIGEIATNMAQERDLRRVKDQLECIEQAVKVLKLLNQ